MTGVGIIHQLEEARRSRVPPGEVISLYRVNTNKSHKPVKSPLAQLCTAPAIVENAMTIN